MSTHPKTDTLAEQVYREFLTAKANTDSDMGDFEANLDCLDGRRTEKDYEWMSDISTHDYASIVLTEASTWANQYFQSRDFVDPILEGDKPEDMRKSSAAKKVINKSLNNREIYHYQKYMRARTINATASAVHALCWWEKDVEVIDHGKRSVPYPQYLDDFGAPSAEPTNVVTMGVKKVNVTEKRIHKDYFNYDVIDPRNIFYSNNYSYSLQDKDWIIIRSEEAYETLLANEKRNGYFNLDKLMEVKAQNQTDTASETYNKQDQQEPQGKPVLKYFDKLMRFGKIWAVVVEVEADGYPKRIVDGFDEFGKKKDNAELVEAIVEMVVSGSSKTVIRFQPQFCRTKSGRPYRPIVRGLCYIHPVKDIGVNDGKYLRQLQVAVDDTINMSNDRVQMATFPFFAGKRYVMEDNDTFVIKPEGMVLVDDPATDIQEFRIRDNIQGALQQVGLLMGKMQQLPSVYPTTMGNLPDKASTTATAIAGAESRGNLRANYKSLTFEYTYNLDFYWMVLQMFWQFAEDETAADMLGEDAAFFDPDPMFTYQPVSSNIEMEANKYKKIQNWDQFIGRAAGLAKVFPQVIGIIAYAFGRIAELQGDEYRMVAPLVKALANAKPVMAEQGTETPPDMQQEPASNQNGMAMSNQEMFARAI